MPPLTMGFFQPHGTRLHAGCSFSGRVGLSTSRLGPLANSSQKHKQQERWPQQCRGRLLICCRAEANGSSAGESFHGLMGVSGMLVHFFCRTQQTLSRVHPCAQAMAKLRTGAQMCGRSMC